MNGVETHDLVRKTEAERMNLESAISEVNAHFKNFENGSVAINNFVVDLSALIEKAQDLQNKVSEVIGTKMIKKR